MAAEAYPLHWPPGWPRNKYRSYGPFQVTPDKALQSLYEELGRLGASHLVISSNCPLRLDGRPYAEALAARNHKDPGVAVYFQFKGKPMVMAQDAYLAPYSNIRSLALAIAALRAIERHGGGYMMQRSFEGFAQLPPPEGHTEQPQRPWREVLNMTSEVYGQMPIADLAVLAENRWKTLARQNHPDTGGSPEAMAELNLAIAAARAELTG